MIALYRYVNIAVSVFAWSGVLLLTTYWSHTLAAFGQYSLNQSHPPGASGVYRRDGGTPRR